MTFPAHFDRYRPSGPLAGPYDEFGDRIAPLLIAGLSLAITQARRGFASLEPFLTGVWLLMGETDCRRDDVHKLIGSMLAFLLHQHKYYKSRRIRLGENPCDVRWATLYVHDPHRPDDDADADPEGGGDGEGDDESRK